MNPSLEEKPESSMAAMKSSSDQDLGLAELDGRVRELTHECPPFYKNHNLLILYLLMIPGCLVPAVTLGFDAAMINGLQSVPYWDAYFNHPRGSILGLLTSFLPLGAVVATPFISVVGDKLGRRWGIFTGGTIMAIGGALQGCSQNFGMFLGSRFIIGFGVVFANTYAPVLIGELAHPKDRQVATSLYQTSYYFGSIMAAWITFGTFNISSEWSWRIPSLLQVVPALVQMCAVWFLPESPRWLLAKGRTEQARAVLVKYHANGNENDEFVRLAFKEMETVIRQETAHKTTWKSLLQTPGNRRRMRIIVMLGLFSQWSGNGLVSYYLARVLETVGITSARDQNIINGSLQIFNWITAVSSAFLTAKLKRRTQFIISGVGMFIVFCIQTLCAGLFNEQQNTIAGKVVIPMLFMFYIFYNLAFNALLYSYPVEFLPYPIRAKGMSVLMFFGKSAVFINAYVNPIGLQAIGWKYYIVYVVWLSIEVGCIYFFIVETKGPSLEAVAEKFDAKNPPVYHEELAEPNAGPNTVVKEQ